MRISILLYFFLIYTALNAQNVGVNIVQPQQTLDVRGITVDTGATINLGNANNSHFLRFFSGRNNDANPFVWWREGESLRFAVGDGSGIFKERMRIRSGGTIGINHMSPQFPLHVREPLGTALLGDQPVIFGEYTNTTTLGDVIAIKGMSKPGDYYGIGGSFEGGWKGVFGTVSPTGTNTYIGVQGAVNGGSGTNYAIFGSASGTGINWAGYFDAGNVYVGNRLGIGQTNPLWPIDMSSNQAVARMVTTTSVNGSVIELKNTTVTPTFLGAINFNNAAGTTPGQIAYEADHEITFRADGIERMKIDKTGSLNIGTGNFLGTRLNVSGGLGRFLGGIAVFKTAAVPENIAIFGDASGGTNNWAGYFSNGNVHVLNELRIGTTTGASGYKVAVQGKIICEELKVQLKANWPDYVFGSEYNLKPLMALENEIQSLGHLPGMPSAALVEKDGVEVGEMQRLLLEKVEELTLYMIQLKKENEEIKSELYQLKKIKK